MRDPRIRLGARGVAAVLAFLIPGAGHFYQGRRVKGGIFAVCILSTFFGGLVLGEGQPVYSQVIYSAGGGSTSAQMHSGNYRSERVLGYYAQIFTGAPAMPALVQAWRYSDSQNVPGPPEAALTSDFEGDILRTSSQNRPGRIRVSGQLRLEPGEGQRTRGTLSGTTSAGEPIELEISGRATLGKPVFGSPRREVRCDLAADDLGMQDQLVGTVSRQFTDWFQAPRDNEELDRMHSRLSQKFDIACVFTWIAGFLNLMATWDAFDGPAYGYGDEEDDEDSGKSDQD